MDHDSLGGLLNIFNGSNILWAAIGIGLAVLSCALLVLMRTRWGQSHPLRKCAVLSVWAHLLMATYAMTVPIVISSGPADTEPVFTISTVDPFQTETTDADHTTQPPSPWDRLNAVADVQPELMALARADSDASPAVKRPEPRPTEALPEEARTPRQPMIDAADPEIDLANPTPDSLAGDSAATAAPIEAPQATRREPPPGVGPRHELPQRFEPVAASIDRQMPPSAGPLTDLPDLPESQPLLAELPTTSDPATALTDSLDAPSRSAEHRPAGAAALVSPSGSTPPDTGADAGNAVSEGASLIATSSGNRIRPSPRAVGDSPDDGAPAQQPPPAYRLRTTPNRLDETKAHGDSTQAEAAVDAALAWLAAHQSADGRWSPTQLEGGREQAVGGRDRQGTGAKADTGVSALAVLAFLGAGHTHLEGDYQDDVRRALEFLLNSQATDGNLSGEAGTYAAMYCHGMATLALCEAYAMTGDERLETTARRAVNYTVRAQHSITGGWRYRPGDLGDTSQLGWQVLALRSAQLAGIHVPQATSDGAIKFLKSVSSGQHGGLASYRPGEAVSRPMTAEALFSRQILGMRGDNPAAAEAADYLVGELPGVGQDNLYYWYYATLGLYHQQGDHWQQWNGALQETLLKRQVKVGRAAGSWAPDTVWSGYGGRAYSTAMAALCLEVYYRFLPLYAEAVTQPAGLK